MTRPLTRLLSDIDLPAIPAGHLVAPTAAAPALVALAAQGASAPTVVVTATGADAETFAQALGSFMDTERVAVFPAWETLPHERLSPRSDTVARRLATLRRVVHPQRVEEETSLPPLSVVVAPVRALLQPMVAGLADLEPVLVTRGQYVDLTELTEQLSAAAYTRVDMVERRGEYAVRGGIVDVFAPTDAHPIRVEFFGDEVDSLRSFSVADQRSLQAEPRLWAPPCRELLLTDAVRERADSLREAIPAAADMLGRIASGVAVEGMESLIPVLVDRLESFTDMLPPDTRVVAIEPERLARRADDLTRTAAEFLSAAWVSATAGAQAPLQAGEGSFLSLDDVRAAADDHGVAWSSIGPFGGAD
ncbi:MAG: transcription-repair coupling factor, partial [Demequina sp.]